ncbi:uncharacterized protein MYCFIDRAFT_78331 [Pseudocercospora fijiensis CIRAD86]|uniref:Uncharacterized protein n=1 Tax=Pseudocercospora fijiensis (strain CIRAD86) TaxID=383855 RepID=M3A2K4_PSEFD|nr:uncharacterized protein MYCFIDRAFT_78331 [Pseudocercospora fijiensis CIRAD86]EME78621.1 hypothetical protein MYCFIDRAFT_78331 [Pseudocercospora fijiensis CIRAD86]
MSNHIHPTTIDARIQALPQELQDMILKWTLAETMPGPETEINRFYQTPWQLQFNRTSRRDLARNYFASSKFRFDICLCFAISETWFPRWRNAQTRAHLDKITTIQVRFNPRCERLQLVVKLLGVARVYKRLLETMVVRLKVLLGSRHAAAVEISVHLDAGGGEEDIVWANKASLKKLFPSELS